MACARKRCFFAALGLQSFAQAGNLRFQALERFGSRFETQPGLSAFEAQVFLLVARLAYLRVQAFCLALKRRQALFCLCGVVARIARQCEQVHGMATGCLHLPLGRKHLLSRGTRLLLARLDLLTECSCFAGCGLKKHTLLLALLGDAGQLRARALEFGRR